MPCMSQAAEVASGMFRRMQADGVRHVIFLGYFYILVGTELSKVVGGGRRATAGLLL